MKITIDGAGRIVVPKHLREELGLSGGQSLELTARDGRLEIDVAPTPMALESRGVGVVAVPAHELPQLTADTARATLDRLRR